MDEVLTDDQRVLLEASTRLMQDRCPLDRVRERAFDDPAFAAAYRSSSAELGWYSFLVPEELGGGSVTGNGALDAALVAYRRGRALQPGCFVGTNVVAFALSIGGNDEQRTKVLPALISGESSAAWALTGPNGSPVLAGAVTGVETDGGYRLFGQSALIEDPGSGGWILLTASTPDGPAQFLVPADTPGIRLVAVESLDLSRRFVQLHVEDAAVPSAARVGTPEATPDLIDQQLAIAGMLTAAESVGAMDYDFAMTVQYAKDRIAFGRPIGSFQAIKHSLADTSLMLEMSKAITLAAATHVGTADGYALESASMAKAFVGDCAVDLAQNCFQVFGGIGFTWEHDQHLYLRRLTTDAGLYGNPSWHRERLCQLANISEVTA